MINNSIELQQLPEDDLVQHYLAGNQLAFTTLNKRFNDYVDDQLQRRGVRNPEDRHDLEQTIWVVVDQNIKHGKYTEEGNFKGYLYRLTERIGVSFIRQKSRRKIDRYEYTQIENLRRRLLDYGVTDKQLEWCIDHLGVKPRHIIREHFFEEKSFHEIADEMHEPLGTITSAASRAYETLHEMIVNKYLTKNILPTMQQTDRFR